jgi:hypothetical protein
LGTVILSALGGAASATAGWLVHKLLKTRQQVAALEARVEVLEASRP